MGKRKHYDADEEEYLERKIKRLKRQKSRIRRKRRQRSYSRSLTSSMSSRSSTRDYAEYMDEDQICADEQPLQESSQNEELPFGEDVAEDSTTDDRLATRSGLQSVVVRPAAPPQEHHAPTPPPVVAPAPLNQSADATGPSTSAELSRTSYIEGFKLEGPAAASSAAATSPRACEDQLAAWWVQAASAAPAERPPSPASTQPDLTSLATGADTEPQAGRLSRYPAQDASEPYPGCRNIVRTAFLNQDIPHDAADVMLASLTENTLKQYNDTPSLASTIRSSATFDSNVLPSGIQISYPEDPDRSKPSTSFPEL
ncbi:hypothetical protein MSG28_010701 [Choristoneura fumiferana]|uniref:Uncharacterized protein n=1 Tax=Choristoneura fumiferana TaxID=7141 RepID=A0ACC0KNB6_CHOFU|nr:hypothetical protein MSG28_010701 [Choristoneura fumiferana]